MRALLPIVLASFALSSQPLAAALPVGAQAPDFTTMGAVGGKPFKLHLKDQLKHGPLVLYFFPKAFTQGCTLEAKAFADAIPEFKKAGARVVGMRAHQPQMRPCRTGFFSRRQPIPTPNLTFSKKERRTLLR